MLIFSGFVDTRLSAICPPEKAEVIGNQWKKLADRK
jgi:hypothetical protein